MSDDKMALIAGAITSILLAELPRRLFIARDPGATSLSKEELVKEYPGRQNLVFHLPFLIFAWGLVTIAILQALGDTGHDCFDQFFLPLLFSSLLLLGVGLFEIATKDLTIQPGFHGGPGTTPAGQSLRFITVSEYAYRAGWLRMAIAALVIAVYLVCRKYLMVNHY
jgi:hypothetical protein